MSLFGDRGCIHSIFGSECSSEFASEFAWRASGGRESTHDSNGSLSLLGSEFASEFA